MFSDLMNTVSGSPWLALSIILGAIAVLYFARDHAHRGIMSISRVIHNAMRLTSHSLRKAESVLTARNREVLLAAGREEAERDVAREFERVDATVRRDLAEYPALHRKLSEEITRIDEDFQQGTEVPPSPPGWVKAVEAVAKIPSVKGDPSVANILEDIHSSLVKANTVATEEYRKSSHKRHMILNKMMPHWRKLLQILNKVDKNINSLLDRSKSIDRHMDEYENILKGTDRAVRTLSSSSLKNFFISALVLAIAMAAAFVNFQLIALPMSEMVPAKRAVLGIPVSSVAALVIILVELAMGLFLVESLRITRLFPVIGALDDKMRIRMIWITFVILTILACVEAGLAFMRELMLEDLEATREALRGTGEATVVSASFRWITTGAQMGLGFILPFAIAFVAIPLETFVHSSRTVLGILGVSLLRTLSWLVRMIGNIARYTGLALVHVYDLIIFAPLWVEKMIRNKTDTAEEKDRSDTTVSFGGRAA
ncbi:MAG TPA: hypothetical protein ENJ01_02795 [Gammaproteobacteria bacterium]|nr:hypothetical protein [Gammaproteobacteria bacterium]